MGGILSLQLLCCKQACIKSSIDREALILNSYIKKDRDCKVALQFPKLQDGIHTKRFFLNTKGPILYLSFTPVTIL